MSNNPFAALDDSGDEGPAKVSAKVDTKKKAVVEPSKVDKSKRPNHGDRNTKQGRGSREPTRDGKRAYDRRSGTGRGKETKKGGGGARNWGSDKNEARQGEGHVDEKKDPKDPVGDDTERVEDPVVEEEPEPDPEANTLSYEEYMATKANPDNAAFAPVKERNVEDAFSGMAVAKKDEEEDFMKMGGKQKKNKQKKNNTKTSITPAFRVKRSDDGERREGGGRDGGRGGRGGRGRGDRDGGRGGGRGGRGGRDGGRGRGGRDGGRGRGSRDGGRGRGGRSGGGGRGGRGGLNVFDASAFPSL